MPHGISKIPIICCPVSTSPAKVRVSASTTSGESPRISGYTRPRSPTRYARISSTRYTSSKNTDARIHGQISAGGHCANPTSAATTTSATVSMQAITSKRSPLNLIRVFQIACNTAATNTNTVASTADSLLLSTCDCRKRHYATSVQHCGQ